MRSTYSGASHDPLPPLRRLWVYTAQADRAGHPPGRRSYRSRTGMATLFTLLNTLFDLALPSLIGVAVDVVVQREASLMAGLLGITDPMAQLWWLAMATFVIWGLESLTEYVALVRWRNLAQGLQHDLRLATYAHVRDLTPDSG